METIANRDLTKMNAGIIVDNELNNDNRVLKEINILREGGMNIFVICFGFDKKQYAEVKGISISRIRIRKRIKDILFFILNCIPIYEWLWASQIKKSIIRNKIEVLHVHDLYMARAAHSGIRKSKTKIPLILDLHENYPFTITTYSWTKGYLRGLISKPAAWLKKEREYIGYADRIIVLSDDYKESLLTKYPDLSEKKFFVLPNVPDLSRTTKKISDVVESPFRDNYPVMFYYGVIAERRGIFDSLEAFTDLVKDNYKINFLLIGPVDKKDMPRFTDYITMELLAGKIHYIPWIDSSLLPSYLDIVDICLAPFHKNPQHESGVANKIYEYMMWAKPLVVSNCLPQQNLTEKHKCGLVFENMAGFKEALIRLVEDKNLRTELGKNGSEAIKNFYNTGKVEDSLISLYKSID